MKNLIKQARSKGFALGEQAMLSGGNFLIAICLVRILGIESFGVYSFLYVIVLAVNSLAQACITDALLTLFPKTNNKGFTNQVFTIQLMFIALIVGIGQLSLPFAQQMEWLSDYSNSWYLLPLWLGSQLIFDFTRKLAYAKQSLKNNFFITTSFQIGLAGLGLYLYLSNNFTLNNFILCLVSVQVLLSIVHVYLHKLKIDFNVKGTMVKVWHFSKFLTLTSIVQLLAGNIFIVLGGTMLGASAIGIVRLVQNLMGVLNVLFASIENVVTVSSAKIYHENKLAALKIYLKGLLVKAGLPVGVVLLITATFSKSILHAAYGIDQAEFYFVLIAFCILYIPVFINTLSRILVKTIEQNQLLFIAALFSALASLLIAKPLINSFGIIGIIIGIGMTQGLTLLVITIGTFKKLAQ